MHLCMYNVNHLLVYFKMKFWCELPEMSTTPKHVGAIQMNQPTRCSNLTGLLLVV
jgi:hypothetical protein